MLDIILEALSELITGEKQTPPPSRQRPSRPVGESQSSSRRDPFGKEQRREDEPGKTTPVTLEDIIRRLTGMQREEPEPVRPSPARRERQQQQQPAPSRERPQPAPAPKVAIPREAPVPDPAAASGRKGLEFVQALRSNPEAARQAFVYSEIFGRPLGDRMHTDTL